ncbi:hypothetical protein PLICRDRAFT_180606 [Plicaturopsis crispa FD-325 SS-3]|uniref:Uncharacterized protein n=1 Tax=Plicaturopsis crispa FD-325 SS-3 TaxID=944288 RepID=A0A0C9T1Y2_PLICR|nr:hypothetical protein PLICRDRAFT_180606 [Plicaturopsis crispa FD-325 SS-3]
MFRAKDLRKGYDRERYDQGRRRKLAPPPINIQPLPHVSDSMRLLASTPLRTSGIFTDVYQGVLLPDESILDRWGRIPPYHYNVSRSPSPECRSSPDIFDVPPEPLDTTDGLIQAMDGWRLHMLEEKAHGRHAQTAKDAKAVLHEAREDLCLFHEAFERILPLMPVVEDSGGDRNVRMGWCTIECHARYICSLHDEIKARERGVQNYNERYRVGHLVWQTYDSN